MVGLISVPLVNSRTPIWSSGSLFGHAEILSGGVFGFIRVLHFGYLPGVVVSIGVHSRAPRRVVEFIRVCFENTGAPPGSLT